MADERLRTLERKWLQSQSLEDETTLLSERIRHGAITRERLALAGHCDSPAAKALGSPAHTQKLGSRSWSVAVVRGWGLEALAWLDLGALRALLPYWDEARPADPYCHQLFAAIEAQLLEPSEAGRAKLSARLGAGLTDLAELAATDHCRNHTWTAFCCPHRHHYVLEAARGLASRILDQEPGIERLLDRFGSLVLASPGAAYLKIDSERVVTSAVEEVIAWALGHTDALRRAKESASVHEPLRLVDPRLLSALRAAEQAVEANPHDLASLQRLVAASEEARWTHEGRTLADYRQALASGGGVPDQDRRLVRLILPIGLRAIPLALELLPRRRAFFLLAGLATRATAAIAPLVGWLSAPGGHDRGEAAKTLVAVGQNDRSLRKAIGAQVRARLGALSHPEGAVFVLLSFGASGESVAPQLRQVFGEGRWTWILLFDLHQTEALWPAARELGACAVKVDSTTTVRNQCLCVLFDLGERALPALPELERFHPDTDRHVAKSIDRLIEKLRGLS